MDREASSRHRDQEFGASPGSASILVGLPRPSGRGSVPGRRARHRLDRRSLDHREARLSRRERVALRSARDSAGGRQRPHRSAAPERIQQPGGRRPAADRGRHRRRGAGGLRRREGQHSPGGLASGLALQVHEHDRLVRQAGPDGLAAEVRQPDEHLRVRDLERAQRHLDEHVDRLQRFLAADLRAAPTARSDHQDHGPVDLATTTSLTCRASCPTARRTAASPTSSGGTS